jgi:uncharacterized protein (DUF1330 family)
MIVHNGRVRIIARSTARNPITPKSNGNEAKGETLRADWQPRRIVLLEFPSVEVWETLYNGTTCQGLKAIRDACSLACLVGVEGT